MHHGTDHDVSCPPRRAEALEQIRLPHRSPLLLEAAIPHGSAVATTVIGGKDHSLAIGEKLDVMQASLSDRPRWRTMRLVAPFPHPHLLK